MRGEPAIGFFDSGLGGISVLAAAMKALPNERFLYYGDSPHKAEQQAQEHVWLHRASRNSFDQV